MKASHRTQQLRSRAAARLGFAALVLGLLGLAGAQPDASRAAGTDPLLVVDSVRSFSSAAGARTLEVSGFYSFEDLLQFPFPAGLFVTRGSQWVRYGLDGTITQGTNPAVANGLTPAEVETLLASGAPAAAPAAVVRVHPEDVSVTLPATLSSGAGRITLYVQLEDETFVSNSLQVTIP
jgi:hypothetical protein